MLANEKDVREVVAIGPLPMMKACCDTDPAVRRPHHREPQFHHGGWHRHVRLLPRDRGRQNEIRLRGWRRFRRPPGEFRRALAPPETLRSARKKPPWSATATNPPSWRASRPWPKPTAQPRSTCELPEPLAAAPGPRLPKNLKSIPPERVPMPHQPAEVAAPQLQGSGAGPGPGRRAA